MSPRTMSGAERLREAVRLFNGCRESFLDQFSTDELIKLYEAYKRSEWDIAPDEWTQTEILDALAGTGTGAKSDDPRRGEHDGHDECAECGARYNASPADKVALCTDCVDE